MMKRCFGQRAWIGLGVLAAGLLIAHPQAGWVALPALAGLACPVPMIVMMRGMRRGTGPGTAAPGGEQAAGSRAADGERAVEIARLRREIELLKARADGFSVAAAGTGAAAGAGAAAGRADRAGRGRPAAGG
jgi:hypothetical protein